MKMRALVSALVAAAGVAAAGAGPALALNGARPIGFGPPSRAMGGVGIAYPQDALGGLTANPAAAAFRPRADEVEIDLAGTFVISETDAEVVVGGVRRRGRAASEFPVIMSGLLFPVLSEPLGLQAGLSFFVGGGSGVDYRDELIDDPTFYDLGGGVRAPLIAGEVVQVQAINVAPTLIARPLEWLSLGLAVQIGGSTLDLGDGTAFDMTAGFQVGVALHPIDDLFVGCTYVSPQSYRFSNVRDFDQDGDRDGFELELPQHVGVGVAWAGIDGLVLEADVRWFDWNDARGFEDNHWSEQWVFALGAQVDLTGSFKLRAGYNYGRSPIRRHHGFDGTSLTSANGQVQPSWYHETTRTIGIPTITEHHITGGFGFQLTESIALDAAVVYALPNTLREEGTDLFGQPASIRVRPELLLELDVGLRIIF